MVVALFSCWCFLGFVYAQCCYVREGSPCGACFVTDSLSQSAVHAQLTKLFS